MTNDEIKRKIIEYAKIEQQIRLRLFKSGCTPTKIDWAELSRIDQETTLFMKKIVQELGLPTIESVGKEAENFAWVLVQHSPDLEFQKAYLKLLKAVDSREIKLEHIAYLEDRILSKENKPQIYGTQVITDKTTGKAIPYKLQNPEKVDKLRASVGLERLEEYLKSF